MVCDQLANHGANGLRVGGIGGGQCRANGRVEPCVGFTCTNRERLAKFTHTQSIYLRKRSWRRLIEKEQEEISNQFINIQSTIRLGLTIWTGGGGDFDEHPMDLLAIERYHRACCYVVKS